MICRYTDIWRNKIHDDNLEKSALQGVNAYTNEIPLNIRGVNRREVSIIQQFTDRIQNTCAIPHTLHFYVNSGLLISKRV